MKKGRQGEGGGKPKVKFDNNQIDQVEKLSAMLSKSQLSDYFGISENTFRAIEDRQPEVSEAYKKGKSKAIASVAASLLNQAQKGNMTAAIFYLKTQGQYKEDQVVEMEIPPINITLDSRAANAPTK
tara:strand:+ start:469 stop:849 length:381 start_codon:yes stop_codon:yes gene_type:complete